MIEIWDTFRDDEDAKIQAQKTSRGKVWGGVSLFLPHRHPTMGSQGVS